jgi:two-component system, NtrC family, sensor kinase
LKMSISRDLGLHYLEIKKDKAIYFFKNQVLLAHQLKLKLWEADGYALLTYATTKTGDYIESMQALLQGLKIAEDPESEKNIWRITKFSKNSDPHNARLLVLANVHLQAGHLYRLTQKLEQEKYNYLQCLLLAEKIKDPTVSHFGSHMLGGTYITLNKLDSALIYENKALDYSDQSGYKKYRGQIFEFLGIIYFKKGDFDTAKKYFYQGIKTNKEQNNLPFLANIDVLLADLFRKTNQPDSSLIYGKKALDIYQQVGELPGILSASRTISATYKMQNKIDSAFLYQELAFAANDSLNDPKKINRFQNIGFNEQIRVRELEKERVEKENQIRTYAMLTGILIVLLIAFLLYRNSRNRKKANEQLQIQKEEIEKQKKNVEGALVDLKATQTQLIQSEKMASLGELTAGIAHEIQNPLNFVNNFSELSEEMLEELAEEIKDNSDEIVTEIMTDLKQNLNKITSHGKRASSIVKGMLEHSRTSTGKKELVDINVLADEFLRLSYYGFKAKDKSFNADFKTDFDTTLPKINVITQDLGRVILNLINNAFYACAERSRSTSDKDYKPLVTVSTTFYKSPLGDLEAGAGVKITIKDNGSGIPDKIKDKIFQPFFTTKPTGEGTGLGLSLAYDIITKGHGGELTVDSKKGEFTEFTIVLPIKN